MISCSMVMAEELPGVPPNTNPTNEYITATNDQTLEQQEADQLDCYNWTCDLLDWDPYLQYDALVEQGYAAALERRDMEAGLVFLATEGAMAGAVAGDVVGRPRGGAAIGAAIGVTSGIIQMQYLLQPDDPQSQRVIRRYEKDLKKWETKFSGCMSREGYRVHHSD